MSIVRTYSEETNEGSTFECVARNSKYVLSILGTQKNFCELGTYKNYTKFGIFHILKFIYNQYLFTNTMNIFVVAILNPLMKAVQPTECSQLPRLPTSTSQPKLKINYDINYLYSKLKIKLFLTMVHYTNVLSFSHSQHHVYGSSCIDYNSLQIGCTVCLTVCNELYLLMHAQNGYFELRKNLASHASAYTCALWLLWI